MSLGFDRDIDLISAGDTAKLVTYLYDRDDALGSPDDILSVAFRIQDPAGEITTVAGAIGDDGEGLLNYSTTTVVGQHRVIATFTLTDGTTQSVRTDFEVIDPFDPPAPSNEEVIGTYVWQKIEDCFDAEDEGPWLRDMTLNYFNESKMREFIREGLFEINERTPPTSLTTDFFFLEPGGPTADLPMIASGTFMAVLRHLMRSYVEQPAAAGAQVFYEDRRDYLQRWQSIYQIEKEWFDRNLGYFKRRWLGLGSSKLLLDAKAGRLLPAPMRTRTTGRGYWALSPVTMLPFLAELLHKLT